MKAPQVIPVQAGPKTRGRPRSGINQAARILGIPATSVKRALKVASMPEEAKAAAIEAGLDNNHAALERIADAADPVAEVALIVQERSRPKKPKKDRDVDRLIAVWNAAEDAAREEFIRLIAEACR